MRLIIKLSSLLIAMCGVALPTHAKSPEEIAALASKINVLIAGATEGSGVVVEKSNNEYIVLTAWHVIKDNRIGEEILIQLPSGSKYLTDITNSESQL